MGTRMGIVTGFVVLVGLVGALTAVPTVGEAAGMMTGGAKYTLSLTKDYTASPWTREAGWSNRAMGKLGFGLKNALLGWTELFVEPQKAMQSGGNFFRGVGMGIKDAVENTLGGVLHVLTFPITGVDVPLPDGGTQLLSS